MLAWRADSSVDASAGATPDLVSAMRVLGAVNARPQATADPFAAAPTSAGPPAESAAGDQQEQAAAEAAGTGVQSMDLGGEQPVLGAAGAAPTGSAAVQQPEEAQGPRPQAQAAIGWRVTLPFEGPAVL